MKLSQLNIRGFRNFKNAVINFESKSLVIGANDVGKTNLLWALRILLDKSLSEYEIEPKDSDFYAYDDVNEFEILLKFESVTEDCVVAKLKGKINDNDELFLSYKAIRDKKSMAKKYSISIGSSLETMEEIEDRYYRKVLNLKYISCRRDFHNFINKEKHNLFYVAKQNREEKDVENDDNLYNEISEDLKEIDDKIPKLSFISSATQTINEELSKLSIHHQNQQLVFDASSSDIENFIGSVSISSRSKNKSLLIGGDGRLNQIYLSLWAAKHEVSEENLAEVSIVCIEEPEAHLHPHQQRKLSEYLTTSIKSQVILTSHSPQIACEFSPNSIIRLFDMGEGTLAASNGCSKIIEDDFVDFGYRLSIIPAEAFFSDVVLLIEGPSEEFFYKTLAKQIGIDLDRLNISILMVDGIGFSPFIRILNNLNIKWVIRTDNDIFKVPQKEEFRFAGIQRLISYYREFKNKHDETENILAQHENNIKNFVQPVPDHSEKSAFIIKKALEEHNLFLSIEDLEKDLYNSSIKNDLHKFFKKKEADGELEENSKESEIVALMQHSKAIFMFQFLKTFKNELKKLDKDPISFPLVRCKDIVERLQK